MAAGPAQKQKVRKLISDNKKVSRRQFIKAGTYSLGALSISSRLQAAQPDKRKDDSMTVRIAVVQQETVPGAVEKNRQKALSFAPIVVTAPPVGHESKCSARE